MVRVLGATLLPLLLACSPRPADRSAAAAPPDAGLGAANSASEQRPGYATAGDRARWFERLHWPAECEDAFARTRLTDDGGLEAHSPQPGISTVIVRCAVGAYQPTSIVLRLDERSTTPVATVLEFPAFESLDGRTLAPARVTELAGEIAALDAGNTLTVLSLARQLGDCGTWARYRIADGAPVLVAFAARVPCPQAAGLRAEPPPGQPPAGWQPMAVN